jgi:hypothetical protein
MNQWRTALVTGASSGIGASIARRLADDDVRVVVVARREDKLRALEASAPEGMVEVLPADLGVRADLERVDARLRSAEHPIELLVNNAAVGSQGALADQTDDRLDMLVDVNVRAPLLLSRTAMAAMGARGRGWIINVGSIGAYTPGPGALPYGSTKAFLTHLTESMQKEGRHSGVTVTLVAPGFTQTEMVQQAGLAEGEYPGPGFLWSKPDDVAAAALEAAAKGRVVCHPGLLYRTLAGLFTYLPRPLVRRLMGNAWKPEAADPDS